MTCSAPGAACATRRPRARANRPIPFGTCSKGDGTDARASTAVRHSPPCICPLPFGECTGPNKVQRPGSASFSAMQELNSHATAACMPSLHAMCPIRLVPIAYNAPARSIIRGRGRARGRKPSASKCVQVRSCRHVPLAESANGASTHSLSCENLRMRVVGSRFTDLLRNHPFNFQMRSRIVGLGATISSCIGIASQLIRDPNGERRTYE